MLDCHESSRKATRRDSRLPPLFILFSYFILANNAFDLLFTKLEIVIIELGAFIYYLVVEDEKGTWLEGYILMLCYLIAAAAAYFV